MLQDGWVGVLEAQISSAPQPCYAFLKELKHEYGIVERLVFESIDHHRSLVVAGRQVPKQPAVLIDFKKSQLVQLYL